MYRHLMLQAIKEGSLLHLTSAGIHSRYKTGRGRQARQLLKFLWGQLFNAKLAKRYGLQDHDHCPLCGKPDSCTHIGCGCASPMMKALYIDRHNEAVRQIARAIRLSPGGGDALLRLVCGDAGRKVLPNIEDLEELILAQQVFVDTWAARCAAYPGEEEAALEDAVYDVDDAERDRTGSQLPCPKNLPEWLLPAAVRATFTTSPTCGICPDLVYIRGVPADRPDHDAAIDKSACTVFLVEIGFCADLRCAAKHAEKRTRYETLAATLRHLGWGTVTIIPIPIGCAGTLLSSTVADLHVLLSTNRTGSPPKVVDKLLLRLASMAATRLLGIIHQRNMAARSATPAAAATPNAPGFTTTQQQRAEPAAKGRRNNPLPARPLHLQHAKRARPSWPDSQPPVASGPALAPPSLSASRGSGAATRRVRPRMGIG
jgi:hypothetical protein